MRDDNAIICSCTLTVNTLCVVASGKKKVWDRLPDCGPQRARSIYSGSFTRKCIEYAATFYPSSWCFLSAKYGFLLPDDVVHAPGCAKFNRPETHPLSTKKLALHARILKLDEYNTVIVLASNAYLGVLCEVFPRAHVHSPLLGAGGIGKMMSALTEALKMKAPLA
ncbi:MAG: DUF6884 domain-containing protein [Halobacteriota archaeon]